MATGAVSRGGRDHPALALGFGPGLGWEGGIVLTLLAEETVLPCSPPVHPLYYLLKVSGPLQPVLTGGEVSKIIKFLQVL